ncbi:uncharacterized protein [Maniola hyperantus]|uniref:uncharacterized protein isoform X1 n=1 Tax=Aphantopus hyperantus TaxID=2795564 RepID=UPI00214664B3
MAPCRAASVKQIDLLLEFAEGHANLALGGLAGEPFGRQVALKKWEEISRKLNSVGTGCNKTPTEWKRYWTLLKSRTKCKAGDVRRAASETGGGPNNTTPLTPLEKRIIGIIGKVAVEGKPEAQISINIPDLSTQPSMCPSPIVEEIVEEQARDNTLSTMSTDNITEEPAQTQASDPLHISSLQEVSPPASEPEILSLLSTSTNTSHRGRPLRRKLYVPETLDDIMTQCDNQEPFIDMGENCPRWDSLTVNQSESETKVFETDIQRNRSGLSSSSTQTYTTATTTTDEKKMELANNAFGVLVGHELSHVPLFKRRYVMYKILQLIDNNS